MKEKPKKRRYQKKKKKKGSGKKGNTVEKKIEIKPAFDQDNVKGTRFTIRPIHQLRKSCLKLSICIKQDTHIDT